MEEGVIHKKKIHLCIPNGPTQNATSGLDDPTPRGGYSSLRMGHLIWSTSGQHASYWNAFLSRAFVSINPLFHKHVKSGLWKPLIYSKMSILLRTRIFLPCFVHHDHFPIIFYLKLLNISDFIVNSS